VRVLSCDWTCFVMVVEDISDNNNKGFNLDFFFFGIRKI
jgi:hypothetical protein